MMVMISAHKEGATQVSNHRNNKALATALDILNVDFNHAEGVWKGNREPSFVVRNLKKIQVMKLIQLANSFDQEAIMIVEDKDVDVLLRRPDEPYTYDVFNRVYLTTNVQPLDLYI